MSLDAKTCKNMRTQPENTSLPLLWPSLSSLISVSTFTVSHQVAASHPLHSRLHHPCFKCHAAVLGTCLQVVLQLSRSTRLQVRKRIKKSYRLCSGLKPTSECPPGLLLQTDTAAWVMQSGCATADAAKRTEWCPSSRPMCSTASGWRFKAHESQSQILLLSRRAKKQLFFNHFYYVMLFVMLQFYVIVDVSWMCVWFPQKPISVMWIHDSLTVTKASAELLQWHCIYSFSLLSHKGDIWKNSFSALNVQQWKWKPSFADGHFFRKGTSKENSVIA